MSEKPKREGFFKPGNTYGTLTRGVKRKVDHRQTSVIRRMGAAEFAEICQVLLMGNVTQLEYFARNKDRVEPLKAMIASVALRCIERGDYGALNALLDRLIGKPQETLEVKAAQESSVETLKATYGGLMENPETAAALRMIAERAGVAPTPEHTDHTPNDTNDDTSEPGPIDNDEQLRDDAWEPNIILTVGETVQELNTEDNPHEIIEES